MKGTIAETTQTLTEKLTLGLSTMLKIMFRPKVSIFVRVWVVSATVPLKITTCCVRNVGSKILF